MRTLLLLPMLLLLPAPPFQNPAATGDGSAMDVLSYKWTKSRQVVAVPTNEVPAPAQAMTPANKINERNRRENGPAGVRDPNADTIDARSAALEKAVQDARSPKTHEVEGFAFRVKVRNAAAKAVEVLYWEYQFEEASNPSNVARRQFLCGIQIKPGKDKEVLAFGASGPNASVSVESLARKDGDPYRERVRINRVEYADGSIWQRKDWSFAEVRASIARAISTPWGAEMCRGL
jgi:hypothetical protein